MKNFLFLLTFLIAALPLCAYQTGPQNRTHFGAGQPQTAQPQYRSFSNYNNRSWGQGVQTQTVQTEVAGSSAKELKPTVGKQTAPGPAAKPAKPAAVPAPAQASTTPAAMPANVDPAAMMQQVQGMMNAMGNMTGAQPGQQAVSGQNAAAMPATMPDISALMGGNIPTVPATPAKK